MATPPAGNDQTLARRKRVLAACYWLAIAALGWLSLTYSQRPDARSLLVAAVAGLAALRLLYEVTINRNGVPTIASSGPERRRIASWLKDNLRQTNAARPLILDLGSGRGELARTLARRLPMAQVIGIEWARLPHWRARLMQQLFGPPNLEFLRADIFQYDCSGADAVVMFLGKLTGPVGAKLRGELRPGALVISNQFELEGDWPAPEVLEFRAPFRTKLYLYQQSHG